MTVHGSEIVHVIRAALAGEGNDPFVVSGQAPIQSEVRVTANPEQAWAQRDGRLTFDCLARDGLRAFRVTVEVLPSTDDFQGRDVTARLILVAFVFVAGLLLLVELVAVTVLVMWA